MAPPETVRKFGMNPRIRVGSLRSSGMGLPLASTGTSGLAAGCELAFGAVGLLFDGAWGLSAESNSRTWSNSAESSSAARIGSDAAPLTEGANVQTGAKLAIRSIFGIGVAPAGTQRATPMLATAIVKRNQTILHESGRLTLKGTSRISGTYSLDRVVRIHGYKPAGETNKCTGTYDESATPCDFVKKCHRTLPDHRQRPTKQAVKIRSQRLLRRDGCSIAFSETARW